MPCVSIKGTLCRFNFISLKNLLKQQKSLYILIYFYICLSGEGAVNKQSIRPALVNITLEKLIEINPFYKDVCIDSSW